MLKLGMIPSNFPMVENHDCNAYVDVEKGVFPTMCQQTGVMEASVTKVVVNKIGESDKKEVEGEEKKMEKKVEEETEERVSITPVPTVGPFVGEAVDTIGLAIKGASCKPGLAVDSKKSKQYFKDTMKRLRSEYQDVLMNNLPVGHTMRTKPAKIKF